MNQTKNILFLVLAFIIVGLLTVFFTHQTIEPNDLVSSENYATHIQPWLESVYIDQSLTNIATTKDNFLNLKGADYLMGEVHISLFLAFDTWERFLLTGEEIYRQQSIKNFSSVASVLPELSSAMDTLENLLRQQDV